MQEAFELIDLISSRKVYTTCTLRNTSDGSLALMCRPELLFPLTRKLFEKSRIGDLDTVVLYTTAELRIALQIRLNAIFEWVEGAYFFAQCESRLTILFIDSP
jgi:hypothetical protein